MPYYVIENGGSARVPVAGLEARRLTVCTDIGQPACNVTLHSGENRLAKIASGTGAIVNDLELDPEVLEVRVAPTGGGPTPMFITIHASR